MNASSLVYTRTQLDEFGCTGERPRSSFETLASRAPQDEVSLFAYAGRRKDRQDRLYPQSTQRVEIDAEVREEYWTKIRGMLSARVKNQTATLSRAHRRSVRKTTTPR